MRNKYALFVYLVASSLFSIGILAQVFLVGLSLLGGRPSWDTHRGLGHGLGFLALLMIIFAYMGRLPRPMKRLTWLNFGLYFVLADIVIFQRDSAPVIAALHPVLAVMLFPVAGSLTVLIWRAVRAIQTEVPVAHNQSVEAGQAS